MAVALALGTSLFYGVANYLGPLVSRRLPIAWFGPISVVVPIGALGAVVPVVVGLLSGERPGDVQLVGIPLAIGGVMLVGSGGDRRSEDRRLRKSARAVVLWSLLAAGLFGLFLTAFAQASDEGPLWATLDTRISMVAVVLVAVAWTRAARPLRAGELPAVALPGLLLVLGTLMFAEATTRGLLSVVSVIATLFPVVTVTLALLLLRERLDLRQAAGIGLALAGVAAIAAG